MSNFPYRTLDETFHWAYRVTATRLFAQETDVLVPFADHLNHGNVNISMEICDENTLNAESEIDYKDFLGVKSTVEDKEMPKRTFRNRFEKYKKANPKTVLKVNNVWELNRVFAEYRSSEDEEEYSEEEEEDSEEEEEEEGSGAVGVNRYYVLKTGARGSCKAGKQLFNCYGSYSNRHLLLYYGFAMPNNPYDSLRVRVWNPAFRGRSGLISMDDIIEKNYTEELNSAKIDDVTQVFHLKYNKINHSLLTYYRQIVLKSLLSDPSVSKSLISVLQASPTTELVEIPVLEHVLALLNEVERQRFGREMESDVGVDLESLPVRVQYAVVYRMAQKRILQSQKGMLTRLMAVLRRMKDGIDLTEAHMTQGNLEELYPLMAYLRSLQVNNSRWTQEKTGTS